MIDVCLLGTGGMMPLPYRFLTSLLVRYNGTSILVDCGEGTQVALRKKGWSPNPIGMMLFTHYHADHISGLPGMLLTMGNADRTEPLTMVGPKGLEKVAGALRVIAPGLPFEIRYQELTEKEETISLPGEEDFTIRAFRVRHSIPCYCYSMELKRAGLFDLERAMALDVPKPFWGRLQRGETLEYEGRVLTPDMVLGPPRKGLKLCYATDTRPCPSIVEAARDAELFICEGMYGDESMIGKARENRHMTFCEAGRLAAEAGAKELWLTHYSPSLGKPDDYMDGIRAIYPGAVAARDGRTTTLKFD
jgi:ribonuclease Z